MKIRLISVGNKMPNWVSEAYQNYQKRLTGSIQLELVEISLNKRGKNADIKRLMEKESQQMLAAIPPRYRVVCLDVKGKALSTENLASKLEGYEQQGENIVLFIGGPEGLSDNCLAKADEKWSLSAMTLPHPMVRVILAEQIYRAWSINTGHPYHR
ncbi:MAG: 23S rRNA (pseudouridine(1915)-N(3))-methyltransferase RlmH [Pseudomonadales bacterium]|nr:23S rRNA (pseudouridine(1915)-N(3))-methyltransferase RlmH [Pseudomonadales bacterium]